MPVGQLQPVPGDQGGLETRSGARNVRNPGRADAGVPGQARRPRVDDEPLAQARRGRLRPREERKPVEELPDLVVEPGAGHDRVGCRGGADPTAQHAVQRRRAVPLRSNRTSRGARCERSQRQPDDRSGGGPAVGGRQRPRGGRLELLDHLRRGRNVQPEGADEAPQEPLVPLVTVVSAQRSLQKRGVLGERLARRTGARSRRRSGTGSAASPAASAGTPRPGSCAPAGRRSPPRSGRWC